MSDTAEYGDYTRGPRIIGAAQRAEMKAILGEIQSGAFAKEWIAENAAGTPAFRKMRQEGAAHPIEEVGRELRGMMRWIRKQDSSDPDQASPKYEPNAARSSSR